MLIGQWLQSRSYRIVTTLATTMLSTVHTLCIPVLCSCFQSQQYLSWRIMPNHYDTKVQALHRYYVFSGLVAGLLWWTVVQHSTYRSIKFVSLAFAKALAQITILFVTFFFFLIVVVYFLQISTRQQKTRKIAQSKKFTIITKYLIYFWKITASILVIWYIYIYKYYNKLGYTFGCTGNKRVWTVLKMCVVCQYWFLFLEGGDM